jgi:hypothetical protein
MAPRRDDRRGAAVYGREPDAALVAALVAARSRGRAAGAEGAAGAEAPPAITSRQRRARTAIGVGAAAALAVVAAVGAGTLDRGAAPAFEARPAATPTVMSDRFTATFTIPVVIHGAPSGCRFAVELSLKDPSAHGVAQFSRVVSFVRTHRWAPVSTVHLAGRDRSGQDQRMTRSLIVSTAVRQGMAELDSRPADAHWSDSVDLMTSSRCGRG